MKTNSTEHPGIDPRLYEKILRAKYKCEDAFEMARRMHNDGRVLVCGRDLQEAFSDLADLTDALSNDIEEEFDNGG